MPVMTQAVEHFEVIDNGINYHFLNTDWIGTFA